MCADLQAHAEAAFSSFVRLHSKDYESQQQYNERLNAFKTNVAYISAHNAEARPYKVHMQTISCRVQNSLAWSHCTG